MVNGKWIMIFDSTEVRVYYAHLPVLNEEVRHGNRAEAA